MAQLRDIYINESVTIEIPEVTLKGLTGDVLMDGSSAGATPDAFTYEIRDAQGNALSPAISGSLTHVSDGTYRAIFLAPPRPGRYHVHVTPTEGTAVGFKHTSFLVKNRE